MKGLNSLILEGSVSKVTEENDKLTFTLKYEENECFTVECNGAIVKAVSLRLKKNVRIVGRLHNSEGKTVIVAEHLEFKY